MGTLDKLHQEQDDFIKNTFAEDQIIYQPIIETAKEDLNVSKVKVKKYTYKQKRIIIILAILLILSASYNIYLLLIKPYVQNNQGNSNNNLLSYDFENENTEENIIENIITNSTNNLINNTMANNVIDSNTIDNENTTNTNEIVNEVTNEVENSSFHASITPEKTNTTQTEVTVSDDINTDELKDLIAYYGYGINRFSFGEENDESNTIFLYVAKQYFNRQSTSSSKKDTKYAGSKDNIHAYLNESFGIDCSSKEYLHSYSNYIGYNQASKTYILGRNYTTLSKEKYTSSDVTITSEKNGIYTATCQVSRTLDNVTTNYNVEFTFSLNVSYTYSKYNIKSLNAKNTSFYPDNTVHFVEN